MPILMVVVAKDSGSTKLEVMPGSSGAATRIFNRSIPGGREAMFANYDPVGHRGMHEQLSVDYDMR